MAVRASSLPAEFIPAGNARGPGGLPHTDDPVWHDRAREQTERLRKRTRELAVVNSVAVRLAELSDPMRIAEAAVDELDRGFEHFLSAILRVRGDGYLESVAVRGVGFMRLGIDRWAQPLGAGLIGRAVRERRPVLSGDVRAEPDYRIVPGTFDVRSEIAVPIWVGTELWGAIDLEEVRPEAFDEDDARLMQTIAAQVGLALRAATHDAADSESSSARQSRSTLAS
jgi:GAF domain-containing protein